MPLRNVVGRSGTECTATDGVRLGLLECYKIASTPTEKNENTQRMSYAMLLTQPTYIHTYTLNRKCVLFSPEH
jgi:hypothetical protein